MKLFHTSATEIKSVSNSGRFGSFLFFSASEYVMTAGEYVTYSIEISENDIIEASQLFYSENARELDALVDQVATRFDVDSDTAAELIDESVSIYDIESNVDAEDLAEASWDIQKYTARAAKLLGYRAVSVRDEQGSAYMIDMLGREADLQKAASKYDES